MKLNLTKKQASTIANLISDEMQWIKPLESKKDARRHKYLSVIFNKIKSHFDRCSLCNKTLEDGSVEQVGLAEVCNNCFIDSVPDSYMEGIFDDIKIKKEEKEAFNDNKRTRR